jgi:hypothetical protein
MSGFIEYGEDEAHGDLPDPEGGCGCAIIAAVVVILLIANFIHGSFS